MDEWRKVALQLQQNFYEMLGNRRWDLFKGNQRWVLASRVAFALFGGPKNPEESKKWEALFGEPKEMEESEYWEAVFDEPIEMEEWEDLEDIVMEIECAFTAFNNLCAKTYFESILDEGYTEKERKEVERICNKIYVTTRSEEILLAFLFVVGISDSGLIIQPIFRVKKYPQGKVYFVDILGRVYRNWEDYKENNKLPAVKVLYPASGIYDSDVNGKVLVEYANTPARSIKSKLFALCDKTVVLTSLGMALMPVSPPLVLAVTAANYGYKSSQVLHTLHDRFRHSQNNFSVLETCDFWLNLMEPAIGMGSKLATMRMVYQAAKSKEVGINFMKLVDFLNFGKVSLAGARTILNVVILVENIKENKWTVKDVIHICSSFLFFANSAMNFKTAATIIEEVQTGNFCDFNVSENCYSKLVQEVVIDITVYSLRKLIEWVCRTYGKELIKLWNGIKIYIRDLYEYFAHLFRRYLSSKGKSTFPFNKINNFITLSEKFAQLKECETKEDYMEYTRFLAIYVEIRWKEMEDDYQRENNKAEKLMGEEFHETAFAFKLGVTDVNDRERSFKKTILDEMERSMVDLQRKFENIDREISAFNEDGGLKFRSNCCALNEYLQCSVIDGEELSLSDFFCVIREVVDENLKIKSDGTINTYCNEVILVNVEKCNEGKFLKSVLYIK